MLLPPNVIQRGNQFLGPNGWTPTRRAALSFESDKQAREWLQSCDAKLVQGAKVGDVPDVPDNLGQPAHVSDYDPHAGAA